MPRRPRYRRQNLVVKGGNENHLDLRQMSQRVNLHNTQGVGQIHNAFLHHVGRRILSVLGKSPSTHPSILAGQLSPAARTAHLHSLSLGKPTKTERPR